MMMWHDYSKARATSLRAPWLRESWENRAEIVNGVPTCANAGMWSAHGIRSPPRPSDCIGMFAHDCGVLSCVPCSEPRVNVARGESRPYNLKREFLQ